MPSPRRQAGATTVPEDAADRHTACASSGYSAGIVSGLWSAIPARVWLGRGLR